MLDRLKVYHFYTVYTYYDKNVRFDTGDLCCHQMPVFLSGEVSCVQQLQCDTQRMDLFSKPNFLFSNKTPAKEKQI